MDNDAFEKIVEKTFELKDIRVGLFLLKESGNFAEEKASKKIIAEHALKAIDKLKEYNKPMELDEDESSILELIKLNPEKTTPELFEIYQKQGGDKTDRTFHRKLKNLEKERTRIEGKVKQESELLDAVASEKSKLEVLVTEFTEKLAVIREEFNDAEKNLAKENSELERVTKKANYLIKKGEHLDSFEAYIKDVSDKLGLDYQPFQEF